MSFFYVAETGGFYLAPQPNVKNVGITDAEHASLMSGQSSGKVIEPDADGRPVLRNLIQVSVEELLERAKADMRTMRAPMLDALTGIAGRAERAGNDTLAAEADALAEQLLDITDDQALNAATTYEEMQAAGVAAYKRIAGSASKELATVFREITGA